MSYVVSQKLLQTSHWELVRDCFLVCLSHLNNQAQQQQKESSSSLVVRETQLASVSVTERFMSCHVAHFLSQMHLIIPRLCAVGYSISS